MTVLFIFLDGVGLGENDEQKNPFARAELPNLQKLLGGRKLLASTARFDGKDSSLLALDASMGVEGLPQSATGQAVLLTGKNVPAEIGYHYGPKPDKATAAHLEDGGIFGEITRAGKGAALVNAYPPGYFEGINSGKRIYSAIPLAVTKAGLPLFSQEDLISGQALSADFTARGWAEKMNIATVPILSLREAGAQLAEISRKYDFAFFEYWLTDYAGHGQDMDEAVELLGSFDVVLGGLVEAWDARDMILITSDHGNMEDLSTRRHTSNPVPLLLIGNEKKRRYFENNTNLSEVFSSIKQAVEL